MLTKFGMRKFYYRAFRHMYLWPKSQLEDIETNSKYPYVQKYSKFRHLKVGTILGLHGNSKKEFSYQTKDLIHSHKERNGSSTILLCWPPWCLLFPSRGKVNPSWHHNISYFEPITCSCASHSYSVMTRGVSFYNTSGFLSEFLQPSFFSSHYCIFADSCCALSIILRGEHDGHQLENDCTKNQFWAGPCFV